jgi:hypothetical protein
MEKPGIVKPTLSRVRLPIVIILCSFYTYCNNPTPKSMLTRGTVKGLLHDTAGRPVVDAVVMIVEGSSEFNDIASVSDDNGQFYISNVVIPGRYVLQINRNNQQKRKQVNLSSEDSIVRITY